MPAPKGNSNALKHGLYAGRKTAILQVEDRQLRKPTFAIQYLEDAIDLIHERMMDTLNVEEFTRLAGALSLATTALFNGHRTLAYLTGGMTPVEDALRELKVLDFSED